MNVLYFTPIVLSLLLFGAHLYRQGSTWSLLGILVLAGLLFVRRSWAARTVQVALLLATAEWIRTLVQLVTGYMQGGRPFLRLAVILICVILLTGISAFLFQSPGLRARYRIGHRGDWR